MNLKKSLLSLILSAELFFSGCSSQNSINSKWLELQNNLPKNLIEAHDYLYHKIEYAKEKKEEWDSARITVEKGYGDCEEIAILGAYFAEKLGYSPKALFLVDKKEGGHLITLLEETSQGKKYGAFEHEDLFHPVYNSIDELVNEINKLYGMNYYYYSVLELNSLDENWRISEKNLINNKNKKILALCKIKLLEKDKERTQRKKEGYKVGSFILKR